MVLFFQITKTFYAEIVKKQGLNFDISNIKNELYYNFYVKNLVFVDSEKMRDTILLLYHFYGVYYG